MYIYINKYIYIYIYIYIHTYKPDSALEPVTPVMPSALLQREQRA